MKLSAITILFFIICRTAVAQFQWAKSAGGTPYILPPSASVSAVATDVNGNVFITGFLYGTSGFDTITLSHPDFFIAKYDAAGNVLWAKDAPGDAQVSGICTDANGNAYITGTLGSGTSTFGSFTLTNPTGGDVFIVKYNSSGNVVWAKKSSNSTSAWASAISSDAGGNIYIVGNFSGQNISFGSWTLNKTGSDEIFIAKYNSTGNVLWVKGSSGTCWADGSGICTDANGNVYITGTIDNCPGLGLLVEKYNSSGTKLWSKVTNTSDIPQARSINADASGNIYITGGFRFTTFIFGTDTLINADSTHLEIFLAKYDAAGNEVWAKGGGGTGNYVDDSGQGLCTDNSGNVYITGYFRSSFITLGIDTLTNVGFDDIFFAKYNPSGNELWAKNYGGAKSDEAYGIACDASGKIYFAGGFSSDSVSFGNTVLKTVANYNNTFLIQSDSSGTELWAKSASGTYYGDLTNAQSQSNCADASGNVFSAGTFKSPLIKFGSTVLTNADASGQTSDIFLVKNNAAGVFLWSKNAGGKGNEVVNNICTDANGNVYLTGNFKNSSFIFGNDTLQYNGYGVNFFIAKYDAGGNAQWARTAKCSGDNEGVGICTDANGNVLVAGYYNIKIIFGSDTLATQCCDDMFIVKYDANGNMLMAKTPVQDPGECMATSICADANGNIFVGGYRYSKVTFDTITLPASYSDFIVKYDSSLNAVWAKKAGQNGQYNITSVCSDNYGNAFILNDKTIYKFNSAGNLLWLKTGPNVNFGNITCSSKGDIYSTGYFGGSYTIFGNDTLFNSDTINYLFDIFVVKYDTSGNTVWAKSAGGSGNDFGKSICTDANGNLYITGYSNSPMLAFGNDTLNSIVSTNIFIAKLDTAATSGINEQHNLVLSLTVFPNPTGGIFQIMSDKLQIKHIEIFNVLGEKIYSAKINSNKIEIDLTKQAHGIYFIKVNSEKGTITKKIIIQ